jgi:hypothetical protein
VSHGQCGGSPTAVISVSRSDFTRTLSQSTSLSYLDYFIINLCSTVKPFVFQFLSVLSEQVQQFLFPSCASPCNCVNAKERNRELSTLKSLRRSIFSYILVHYIAHSIYSIKCWNGDASSDVAFIRTLVDPPVMMFILLFVRKIMFYVLFNTSCTRPRVAVAHSGEMEEKEERRSARFTYV